MAVGATWFPQWSLPRVPLPHVPKQVAKIVTILDLHNLPVQPYEVFPSMRLGVLLLSLKAGVLLYGTWQIIFQQQYLSYVTPQTLPQTTVHQPSMHGGSCNVLTHECGGDDIARIANTRTTLLDYCCGQSDLLGIVKKQPPQSVKNNTCLISGRQAFDCVYMDGLDVVTGAAESVIIHSYLDATPQSFNDTFVPGEGSLWSSNMENSKQVFIAGIDEYTVGFSHSIEVPDSADGSVSSMSTKEMHAEKQRQPLAGDMTGMLRVDLQTVRQRDLCSAYGKKTLWKDDHCFIPPVQVRGFDIFPVRTLLQALNMSLDDLSGDGHETLRQAGTTIEVRIQYSNGIVHFWSTILGQLFGTCNLLSPSRISYHYVLERVSAPAKIRVEQWLDYPVERLVLSPTGIHLMITPAGKIAFYSSQTLLLTCNTILSLWSAVTAAVVVGFELCHKWGGSLRREFVRHPVRARCEDQHTGVVQNGNLTPEARTLDESLDAAEICIAQDTVDVEQAISEEGVVQARENLAAVAAVCTLNGGDEHHQLSPSNGDMESCQPRSGHRWCDAWLSFVQQRVGVDSGFGTQIAPLSTSSMTCSLLPEEQRSQVQV